LDRIPPPASSILPRNCWPLFDVCRIPRSLQESRDDSLSTIGCMQRFVGTSESAVDCGGSIRPLAFSPTRFKVIAPEADVEMDKLSGFVCGWASRLD